MRERLRSTYFDISCNSLTKTSTLADEEFSVSYETDELYARWCPSFFLEFEEEEEGVEISPDFFCNQKYIDSQCNKHGCWFDYNEYMFVFEDKGAPNIGKLVDKMITLIHEVKSDYTRLPFKKGAGDE